MKGHPWDELTDSSKDYFDGAGFVPEAEFDEEPVDKHVQRRRLTELRRRTEERLDWKRMYGDLQFDDADDERSFRDDYSGTSDDYFDSDESDD
jgi:hypothetical protein